MSNILLSFRVEQKDKDRGAEIGENLGIDLPTYFRICLARLIKENGIPFSMKIENEKSDNLNETVVSEVIKNETDTLGKSIEEINAELTMLINR